MNKLQLEPEKLEPLSSHSYVYLSCIVEAPCAIRTPSTTTVGRGRRAENSGELVVEEIVKSGAA